MAQSKEISEAARAMGRIKSKRKTLSSRSNGRKGGRPFKPLAEVECTCRLPKPKDREHWSYCALFRTLKRRAQHAAKSQTAEQKEAEA